MSGKLIPRVNVPQVAGQDEWTQRITKRVKGKREKKVSNLS
jgi:hypothetical protein